MSAIGELPLIKRIRERIGLLQVAPEELTPAQKELVRKFKEGLADALGVPPEAIAEKPLEKWVLGWTKAFVKEEYLKGRAEIGYELGYQLGGIIKPAGKLR